MSWSLFIDQQFDLFTAPASGNAIIPVEGLTGTQIVIEAISPLARPTWTLAFKVIFERPLPDFPGGSIIAESYGRTVRLGRKILIDVPPTISTPYTVNLSVPYWHSQLQIKIWQK